MMMLTSGVTAAFCVGRRPMMMTTTTTTTTSSTSGGGGGATTTTKTSSALRGVGRRRTATSTGRRIRVRASASEQNSEKFRVRDEGLPRDARVGILGGGQLGRMLAIAGAPMGVRLNALDPTEGAPASIAARQVVGSFRDKAAVKAFAETCDVVTVEIEHIDVEALRELSAAGVDVQPTPDTLATIQDKYAQKVHFEKAGVPLGPFRDAPDAAALDAAAAEFGFPLMIKSKRLAYDGRGNAVAKTAADLNDAVAKLGGFEQGLYCEKWVPFERELAVMVVRAKDGETRAYPVVETVHENNICDTTTTPAPIPNKVAEAVQEAAKKAIGSFTGAGIFGVELFYLADGSILLNECAPRPHNSGHYTIEACACSQYENHLRAILGWPLGDTSLKVGGAVMKNILGDGDGDEAMARAHRLMGAALAVPGASIHWYEKPDMKMARKMGHLTVVAPSAAVAAERMETVLRAAKGDDTPVKKAPQVGIIMGSDSDLPTMSAAAEVLESFGIGVEVTVISAHRTPERMVEYARSAHTRGIRAIIAGAGGAAHLPGMVAAMTPLPVIGVPVPLKYLDGMDSLLSIVQMPKGVPVATVAIGNSANAGLIAARIISAFEPDVCSKMLAYQDDMESVVLNKASKLEDIGYSAYLNQM